MIFHSKGKKKIGNGQPTVADRFGKLMPFHSVLELRGTNQLVSPTKSHQLNSFCFLFFRVFFSKRPGPARPGSSVWSVTGDSNNKVKPLLNGWTDRIDAICYSILHSSRVGGLFFSLVRQCAFCRLRWSRSGTVALERMMMMMILRMVVACVASVRVHHSLQQGSAMGRYHVMPP